MASLSYCTCISIIVYASVVAGPIHLYTRLKHSTIDRVAPAYFCPVGSGDSCQKHHYGNDVDYNGNDAPMEIHGGDISEIQNIG